MAYVASFVLLSTLSNEHTSNPANLESWHQVAWDNKVTVAKETYENDSANMQQVVNLSVLTNVYIFGWF